MSSPVAGNGDDHDQHASVSPSVREAGATVTITHRWRGQRAADVLTTSARLCGFYTGNDVWTLHIFTVSHSDKTKRTGRMCST